MPGPPRPLPPDRTTCLPVCLPVAARGSTQLSSSSLSLRCAAVLGGERRGFMGGDRATGGTKRWRDSRQASVVSRGFGDHSRQPCLLLQHIKTRVIHCRSLLASWRSWACLASLAMNDCCIVAFRPGCRAFQRLLAPADTMCSVFCSVAQKGVH